MADIQWNRHINRLCDLRGDPRFDDMLIGCIAAFHAKGRTSDKQGDWLVRQLDMGIDDTFRGRAQSIAKELEAALAEQAGLAAELRRLTLPGLCDIPWLRLRGPDHGIFQMT